MRASNNKLIVILFEKKLENEFVIFILKRNLSSRTMANGVREMFSANTGWDGMEFIPFWNIQNISNNFTFSSGFF